MMIAERERTMTRTLDRISPNCLQERSGPRRLPRPTSSARSSATSAGRSSSTPTGGPPGSRTSPCDRRPADSTACPPSATPSKRPAATGRDPGPLPGPGHARPGLLGPRPRARTEPDRAGDPADRPHSERTHGPSLRARSMSRSDRPRLQASVELADGHVDFLAGLGDLVAQPLVLALELGRVHAEDPAEEGVLAVVVLLDELVERVLDLVGQVEQELGLPLDLGERADQLVGEERGAGRGVGGGLGAVRRGRGGASAGPARGRRGRRCPGGLG